MKIMSFTIGRYERLKLKITLSKARLGVGTFRCLCLNMFSGSFGVVWVLFGNLKYNNYAGVFCFYSSCCNSWSMCPSDL